MTNSEPQTIDAIPQKSPAAPLSVTDPDRPVPARYTDIGEDQFAAAQRSGFAGAPDIIDNGELRSLIPLLMRQLFAMFAPGHVTRGAAARIWDIRRHLQALYRAETQNFGVWMKRAMRGDPAWQAAVRRDLGGDAALERWESRLAKRQDVSGAPKAEDETTKPAAEPRKHTREHTRKHSCKKTLILTDRSGYFRLAPLPATLRAARGARPGLKPHIRNVACLLVWPKAIALTPEDLRPASPAHSAHGTGNSPAPCPAELIGLWDRLHADHHRWNFDLIIADMMTVSRGFREDFAPP